MLQMQDKTKPDALLIWSIHHAPKVTIFYKIVLFLLDTDILNMCWKQLYSMTQ